LSILYFCNKRLFLHDFLHRLFFNFLFLRISFFSPKRRYLLFLSLDHNFLVFHFFKKSLRPTLDLSLFNHYLLSFFTGLDVRHVCLNRVIIRLCISVKVNHSFLSKLRLYCLKLLIIGEVKGTRTV
jgi:hypothetical protein